MEGLNDTEVLPVLMIPQASLAMTWKLLLPFREKLKLGEADHIVSPGALTIPYIKPGMPPDVLIFPLLSITRINPRALLQLVCVKG